MCWLCGAGLNDCYDFGLTAAWRSSMVDMPAFWAHAAGTQAYVSPLFHVPGFVVAFNRVDWMHAGCLGVLQHVHGNVVLDLFHKLGGTVKSPTSACAKIMNMFKLGASSLNMDPPFHDLRYTMFGRPNKSPKLKLKAAEARYLLPVLEFVLREFFPADDEYSRVRHQCVVAMCRCYDELKAWEPRLSNQRLGRYARQHLMLYASLGRMCAPEPRWALVPKHHLLLHCAETSFHNPALEWNYSDESEIGRATKIAKNLNVEHMSVGSMTRYRGTFHLQ